ncbi:MAG: hypothetical protein V1871_05420 [Planctomycetota bacterium]
MIPVAHRLPKITAGLIIVILFSHLIESAPAPSNTAKSYLLKPNIKEGDNEIINYKLEASANIEVPAMAEHPVIPLYSRLEQEIEQKILSITATKISRMERTYHSSKYYTNKKSKTPKTDSLDGKKIIIEPDGTITPTDLIPLKIKEFISINEHRFSLILPKEEIRPQAEWTIPSEIVVSLFNFSNNKKRSTIHGCTEVGINAHFTGGSLQCLLKKVQSTGLQEIAVIEMIVVLKGEDNGLNIDTTLKGTAFFDIAKARFSTIELSGDLNLEGDQPCAQSGEDRVIGKGKINIFYEFK